MSRDGGASWPEAFPLPLDTFPYGNTSQGILLAHSDSPTSPATYSFHPSGEPLVVPEGRFHMVSSSGELLFRKDDGTVIDAGGRVLYRPPSGGPSVSPLTRTGQWRWVTWSVGRVRGPVEHYLGEWDGKQFLRVLRTPALGGLQLQQQIDERWFFGRLDDGPAGTTSRQPVLVDMRDGVVHPLVAPVDPGSRYFSVVGVRTGRFTVARPGTGCLNIRTAPSLAAPAVVCVADGVLLGLRDGETMRVDGVEWVPVEAPGDRPGWASAEFLDR
jgi:hypothetical protein